MESLPTRKPVSKVVRRLPRRNRNHPLRTLIVSGLMLSVGSALGFAAGIIGAEVYPADAQEVPPMQQFMQRSSGMIGQYFRSEQPTITLPSDSLFVDSQSRLRAEGLLILNQVADELAKHPNLEVMVAVHTDNVGDTIHDRQLSLMQARAVQLYLEKKLGNDRRWLVIGYGASNPIAANTTDIGRQRNRRVELILSLTRRNKSYTS